jgi:hypothetical protein
LVIAAIPSDVSPGQSIELVRDLRGGFHLRRVTGSGHVMRGYSIEVPREHAEQFVAAASKAGGGVFHGVDDPEPGVAVRYLDDGKQPIIYRQPHHDSAAGALLRLLTQRPNEVIRREDVEQELGRKVGRSTFAKAARRMPPWMTVVTQYGRGSGYYRPERAETTRGASCLTCTAGLPGGRCSVLPGKAERPGRTTCSAYRRRRG